MPCASIRLTSLASKTWNWPSENYSNNRISRINSNNRIKTRKTPLKTKISPGKNHKKRATTSSPHLKVNSRPSSPHLKRTAPVT